MDIQRRSDIFRSSTEEIKKFFLNAVFRGDYTDFSNNPENKLTWACGKIENITVNGQKNDFCPSLIFVPNKFKNYLKNGLCEFKATIDLKALYGEHKQYKLLIINIKNVNEIKHNIEDEKLFRHNLKLKDNLFIGQFTENKDGSFAVRDIRRSDFSKLILQNGKEQYPIVYHPHIFKPKDGKYYEFSWLLNGVREGYVYLFKVDETKPFTEIYPKDVVSRLHNDIMNYPPGASQKIVKMLDTLKNQLSASGEEIFIYELLQNANDYPYYENGIKQKVDVEFHLTLTSLIFMHSGAEFNERNIAAICSINDKEKDTNKEAIGYKGIGFKTVFLNNDNVYLQTGSYSFRFDHMANKDVVDTAWQILPIWTKYQELTPAERAIFTQADDSFRVKFSLTPIKHATLRDSEHNYENMFREIFKNERVILFIPNLSSVKIYLKGTPIPDIICSRNNDTWRVDDFSENINEDITKAINEDIDEQEHTGGLKIPTKYYDFEKTKVSFACEVDGRKLKAVKDTCLYCYLPAKDATWGLKFLMNTDMIPNGARDDVEVDFSSSTNVNETIANIAGSKLFEWILKLSKSGEFELDSIYDLIPNFASLKIGRLKYKVLINSFEKGFVDRIETDELVPTQSAYASLLDVVVDETGLTSSNIITDEEFLKFSDNVSKKLPVFELRGSKSFESFAELYLRKFNVEDNIFDNDSLHQMISRIDFQEWLKIQENNNNFLKFLLDNDLLEDFFDEKIFIGENTGILCSSEELFYDIDEELNDLSAFRNYLSYLSLGTRKFFKNNEDWENIIEDNFADFDREDFIKNTLLKDNWDDTIKVLKNWNNSFHFYHYIAHNEIIPDELTSLPFFNDEEDAKIVSDFNNKFVFITSVEGNKICAASWLSSVSFAFVSAKYDNETLEYLKSNAGVCDFSEDIIVKDIILSKDYSDDVNISQQEKLEYSIDFVKYCFAHAGLFDSDSLCHYALYASDCNGNNEFILSENNLYFPSTSFDTYSKKEWLDIDWMYCLDSSYLNISLNKEVLKDFLKDKFNVKELNDQLFYQDVVRKKIQDIIDNICGCNDEEVRKNLDFVSYLDNNYKLIFEEQKDADKFSSFVFLADSEDGSFYNIDSDAKYIYAYNKELELILDSHWFPSDTVHMCSCGYDDSKAITAIKAKKYEFGKFFDEVITSEIQNINDTIDSKESSIAFHNFIIARLRLLTDPQKEVMKGAKVYLCGCDDASKKSNGHKILSKSARELAELGLVEFSALDIIDPDYNVEANEDYWKKRLDNTPFEVEDFLEWLDKNTETFYETIQNRENNIKFWRWIKECKLSDETLEGLPILPIFINEKKYTTSDDIIYLSDEYIEEGGLEAMVKSYHPDALFISPDYIKAGDNIAVWKIFWTQIGIRFEMVDILIDTIDNRLSEVEDENLPGILVKYRLKLEEHYDNKLVSKLTALKIKAPNGPFYNLSEVIYVNCEKEEPFKYIVLPNQVRFGTADERKLIKEIIDEIGGTKIERLVEWRTSKINRYLEMQKDTNKEQLLHSIHFRFIDELADMYTADEDSLEDFVNLTDVLLLDINGNFTTSSDLTEGSVYKPFCDFERFGLVYHYLSNNYRTNCKNDIRKMFNHFFKVHCDFKKGDIEKLSNRNFAIYFWSEYLLKKDADIDGIKKLINKREFDLFSCIPTKDYIKKTNELYSLCIQSYVIDNIDDWENKLPLSSLPKIVYDHEENRTLFDLILNDPSNLRLSFCDSLHALTRIPGQERRKQLLEWMIETYKEEYETYVDEYRANESALWKNVKGENKPISGLYALSYNDKSLEQYFGNLPQILKKDYLPAGLIPFRKACDILKVKTIVSEDLIVNPIEKKSSNLYYITNLKLYALVLSVYEDSENWSLRYKKYSDVIDSIQLWCCKAISVSYKEDENVCQHLKKFYHEKNSSDFYFVKSLDEKRVFKPFVESFKMYLGIEADADFVETVMESRDTALELIKEKVLLASNDDFIDAIEDLIPGMRRKLRECKEEDTVQNETKNDYNSDHENSTNLGEDETQREANGESNVLDTDVHSSEDSEKDNLPQDSPIDKSSNSDRENGNEFYEDYWREFAEKIKEFMGGDYSLPTDKIKSEHIITRYRTLQYIKHYRSEYIFSSNFDEKAYIRTDGYAPIPLENGKHINVQSVKFGIWHLSPTIWKDIVENGNIACLCTGNKEHDFKFIKDSNDIKELAESKKNVFMRLTPTDDMNIMDTIKSVFDAKKIILDDDFVLETIYSNRDVHLMLMVHETKEPILNSMFDGVFRSGEEGEYNVNDF